MAGFKTKVGFSLPWSAIFQLRPNYETDKYYLKVTSGIVYFDISRHFLIKRRQALRRFIFLKKWPPLGKMPLPNTVGTFKFSFAAEAFPSPFPIKRFKLTPSWI